MAVTGPRPEKGTPEYDLWVKAIDIAIGAPWKGGKNVWGAKISWEDIDALREILDRLGLDWRSAKTKNDERRRENMRQASGG